jgi:lysylphosphatidylglycerol synthetase-like protein (DUF2156 family)
MPRVQGPAPIVALAATAAAGAAAAAAPFLSNGLLLTGSACGGGGSEQRCIGLARGLSLVEISPRAWLFVAGGVLSVVLAAAAILALRRGWAAAVPPAVALALGVAAVAGVFALERVAAHVDPAGAQGTTGRLLEDWHPFLEPELRDMREDALRSYAGRPTEPGGPVYDREQILGSFSVREQTGWSVLRWALAAGLFAALLALALQLTASLRLAVTLAGTAGIVTWALAFDGARPCDSSASECYDGVVTFLAVGAAVVWWVLYALGSKNARRRGEP